jgi:hypothetical protein
MAVAAASLLAAEPPSSTESSGDKAGRAAYQLRQPILSEVGFPQQQQQEQQQEEQEEEEAIDSLDFAGGSDDDAKANMENEAQNMDFDEVEVSEQEAGKTALEAWSSADQHSKIYIVRTFVAKSASDRTKYPAMTPHVGVIQSYDEETGFFSVLYADGDSEDMDEDQATNCMV